jgi:hypothetical protein
MNDWEVGAMEREVAEENLHEQKSSGKKFHALPFLVRKGNKGLTLSSEKVDKNLISNYALFHLSHFFLCSFGWQSHGSCAD